MKKSFFSLLCLGLLIAPSVLFAQAAGGTPETPKPKFDANQIFPTWEKEGDASTEKNKVEGVIGKNKDAPQDAKDQGEMEKLALLYIPTLIDILLKFIAPIVMAMFVYSGIQFVYAGDEEEKLNKSKDFFSYALMGVVFIVTSYSIMKVVYYLLAS